MELSIYCGPSSVISEISFLLLSQAATGCCFVCCCVGLAQFSRPEYGLSGIRGGILGTGRLQHRQILSVGRVSTKFRAEARHGGKKTITE